MKSVITTAISACFVLGASAAWAGDAKKPISMEDCQKHMTMTKAADAKKDPETIKTTKLCTEMLTKEKKK